MLFPIPSRLSITDRDREGTKEKISIVGELPCQETEDNRQFPHQQFLSERNWGCNRQQTAAMHESYEWMLAACRWRQGPKRERKDGKGWNGSDVSWTILSHPSPRDQKGRKEVVSPRKNSQETGTQLSFPKESCWQMAGSLQPVGQQSTFIRWFWPWLLVNLLLTSARSYQRLQTISSSISNSWKGNRMGNEWRIDVLQFLRDKSILIHSSFLISHLGVGWARAGTIIPTPFLFFLVSWRARTGQQ